MPDKTSAQSEMDAFLKKYERMNKYQSVFEGLEDEEIDLMMIRAEQDFGDLSPEAVEKLAESINQGHIEPFNYFLNIRYLVNPNDPEAEPHWLIAESIEIIQQMIAIEEGPKPGPPSSARKFLQFWVRSEDRVEILDNMEEDFVEFSSEHGLKWAHRWYWKETCKIGVERTLTWFAKRIPIIGEIKTRLEK